MVVKVPGPEVFCRVRVSPLLGSVAVTVNLMVSALHNFLIESGAITVGAVLLAQQFAVTVIGLHTLELEMFTQRLLALGSFGSQAGARFRLSPKFYSYGVISWGNRHY